MLWLEKLSEAALAGLFGFVPVTVKAIADRSKERIKASRLGRLREELEFAEKLHALRRSAVLDEREGARTDAVLAGAVGRLTARYEVLSLEEGEERTDSHAPALSAIPLSRRLLLVFQPLTPSGWVLHTLFYMGCLLGGTMLISELVQKSIDEETGEPFGWPTMLAGIVILILVPTVVFRALAVRSYVLTWHKRTGRALEAGERLVAEMPLPRRVALAFRPRSGVGCLFQVGFYLCWLLAGLSLLAAEFLPAIDDETGEPDAWGYRIFAALVVFGLPAGLCWWLALRAHAKSVAQ